MVHTLIADLSSLLETAVKENNGPPESTMNDARVTPDVSVKDQLRACKGGSELRRYVCLSLSDKDADVAFVIRPRTSEHLRIRIPFLLDLLHKCIAPGAA